MHNPDTHDENGDPIQSIQLDPQYQRFLRECMPVRMTAGRKYNPTHIDRRISQYAYVNLPDYCLDDDWSDVCDSLTAKIADEFEIEDGEAWELASELMTRKYSNRS